MYIRVLIWHVWSEVSTGLLQRKSRRLTGRYCMRGSVSTLPGPLEALAALFC